MLRQHPKINPLGLIYILLISIYNFIFEDFKVDKKEPSFFIIKTN